MNSSDITYWLATAHLPRWGAEKINRLIIRIFHENNIDLEKFFNLSDSDWKNLYELNDKEISDLTKAKTELPNFSFLAESLMSQGFEIIPINSPEYSPVLKSNLKTKSSPPLLYIKGNKKLLMESSIAIVGSRDADEISLKFADNISKSAAENFKVVVSGFAKGVDKQALDSSLKYKGQSIIVLPQGILTFGAGIKRYYKQIVGGDVLVLSTFFPNSDWSVGLAMARNAIIYGLAEEIYVAQSDSSGGTWDGAMNGLKKERKVYVRLPEPNEKNANLQLIENGGIPVDIEGNAANVPEKSKSENLSLF